MSSSADRKAPPDSSRMPSRACAAEELAGAVDVAHLEAEEEPQAEAIGARVDQADGRVGASQPKADHDVGHVRSFRTRQQAGQVGDTELAVAIGERDERI